jgi:hypothetical protein
LKHLFEYEKFNSQPKLYEGILQLTPSERDQIEEMLPMIIDVIAGEEIKPGFDNLEPIGEIDFTSADGKPGKVIIAVANDAPNLMAYYEKMDPKNLEDNYIMIQQNNFKSRYFSASSDKWRGGKNAGEEFLRSTLKHELIHAKDPAMNQHKSEKPENYSYEPEVYYKSWEEFKAHTGEFFESIITRVDKIMKSNPSDADIKKIEIALNDILNFYSGKSKEPKQETIDFIQGVRSRVEFPKSFKFVNDIVNMSKSSNKISNKNSLYGGFIKDINKIKKYNPESYNEFLRDLYKTIDQCKDTINKKLLSDKRKGITLSRFQNY